MVRQQQQQARGLRAEAAALRAQLEAAREAQEARAHADAVRTALQSNLRTALQSNRRRADVDARSRVLRPRPQRLERENSLLVDSAALWRARWEARAQGRLAPLPKMRRSFLL